MMKKGGLILNPPFVILVKILKRKPCDEARMKWLHEILRFFWDTLVFEAQSHAQGFLHISDIEFCSISKNLDLSLFLKSKGDSNGQDYRRWHYI